MLEYSKTELANLTEKTSKSLDKYIEKLKKVQKKYTSNKPKNLLIVDSSFGFTKHFWEKISNIARQEGIEDLLNLYIAKLFDGKKPQNAYDLFTIFFGSSVNLIHWDINNKKPTKKIDAMLFTGSPANISFTNDNCRLHELVCEQTNHSHFNVQEKLTKIYEQAIKKNIPVLGVCYGHQLISHKNGGQILRLDEEQKGFKKLNTKNIYEKKIVSTISQEKIKKINGEIAVFHSDVVIPNTKNSASLLEIKTGNKIVSHALIHHNPENKQEEFTGKKTHDLQIIQNKINNRKHLALTFQGHPETSGYGQWLEYSKELSLESLEKSHHNIMAPEVLELFLSFLQNY